MHSVNMWESDGIIVKYVKLNIVRLIENYI